MTNEPITVVVRIRAKPECKAEVRAELLALLAPTRLERGCLNYDMHIATDDEALFLFHENWLSAADLERHLAAPHIQRWIERAEALLAEPMQLTRWLRVG